MALLKNQYKKFIILFLTFVVPLAFFLFLASGRVHFEKLPILVKESGFKAIHFSEAKDLEDRVSVVAFVGTDPGVVKIQEILNLYQVVYKKTEKFKIFQMVLVFTDNFKGKDVLSRELEYVGAKNLPKFKMVNWNKASISSFFEAYQLKDLLSEQFESNKAFIIDDKGRLRGRIDKEKGEKSTYEGYLMKEVADLRNKMYDDLQVLFYEIKFAKKQD